MKKGVKTFNFIRQEAGRTFQDVVPEATDENIAMLSNILFNDNYQVQLNQFVNTLVNRIALTVIRNKSFSNPLAILKKGSTPLGTDIQDIYENPAEAQAYEYSDNAMAQILKIQDPDTHVAYYRVNRRDKYKKTIVREGLQGAFTSWEKFENYIDEITQSLYSGNYIDEFNYTKDLVDSAYENNRVIVEVVDDVEDSSTAKAFLKKCRYLYNAMSFPSKDYNPYSKFTFGDKKVTTWTDKDRVVLLVRADVMAEIDVEALASAFNIDKSNFLGRVIPVDKFDNENILGIICDESFFQIYDNIFRFDTQYNAETMAWQLILHAWGTYAICPFANAVVLATEAPEVEATKIQFGDGSETIEMIVGDEEGLDLTIEPRDATSTISFTSSSDLIFTVEKDNNGHCTLTAVGEGTGTLTATSDNGLTATATVQVAEEEESDANGGDTL